VSAPKLFLRDDFARRWAQKDPFVEIAAVATTPVRQVARRKTFRFELDGMGFYAKVHRGVGWLEIIKNWMVGKAPVLDASNEYRAATRLAAVGLDTLQVAAFGVSGRNPARRDSFLVTDEITGTVTLESYTLRWPEQPPEPRIKRALIRKVADVARVMHGAGINHRDFYICHILVDEELLAQGEIDLAIIDLHRAQIREKTPRKWLKRDLAALLFSVLELPLSRRDWMRFLRTYAQDRPSAVIRRDRAFWDAVVARAYTLEPESPP